MKKDIYLKSKFYSDIRYVKYKFFLISKNKGAANVLILKNNLVQRLYI